MVRGFTRSSRAFAVVCSISWSYLFFLTLTISTAAAQSAADFLGLFYQNSAPRIMGRYGEQGSTLLWPADLGSGIKRELLRGDFNGDGISEAALIEVDAVGDSRATLYDGSGLGTRVVWPNPLNPVGAADGISEPHKVIAKFLVEDINGDGKDDIIALFYTGSAPALKSKISFGPRGETSSAPGQALHAGFSSHIVAADFDADGKGDIGVAYRAVAGGSYFKIHRGPDLSTSLPERLLTSSQLVERIIAGNFSGLAGDEIGVMQRQGLQNRELKIFNPSSNSFTETLALPLESIAHFVAVSAENSSIERIAKVRRRIVSQTAIESFAQLLPLAGASLQEIILGNNSYRRVIASLHLGAGVPLQPDTLQASDGLFTDKIRVSWSAVGGVQGYKIYRQKSGESSFQLIASLNASTTQYDDPAAQLQLGTSYQYLVRSETQGILSPDSPIDSGYLKLQAPNIPAPLNLNASDGSSTLHVALSWDEVVGADGYEILRRDESSAPLLLATLPSGTLTYQDTDAAPGVVFLYSIKTIAGAGRSVPSQEDSGFRSFLPAGEVPPPHNVTASDGEFSNKIRVRWSRMEGIDAFNIYRASRPTGEFSLLGSVGGSAISFDDTSSSLTPHVKYYYRVISRIGSRSSIPSNIDDGYRVRLLGEPLPAPQDLAATDGVFTDKVRVTWEPLGGASSYKIMRRFAGDEEFTLLNTVTTAVFDDTAALRGVVYEYQVAALIMSEETPPSNQDSGFAGTANGVKAILPHLEGVQDNQNGTFTAYFGYRNFNASEVQLSAGVNTSEDKNFFAPAPAARGQVSTFLPGLQRGAFRIDLNNGDSVTWTVQYHGTVLTQVTVRGDSPAIADLSPIVECVKETLDGAFIAHFGYQNNNLFPIVRNIGLANRFLPEPIDRGQPTEFNSGRVFNAFQVRFDTELSWNLADDSANADALSPRCTNDSAPVCNAGVLYAASCQGSSTNIALDGHGSRDPEGAELNFSWTTNCLNAQIGEPSTATPTLTLTNPGLGIPQTCQVMLSVNDNVHSSECSAQVEVSACPTDCSGIPGGEAEVDRCGVCGGDGTSCLDCAGIPFGDQKIDRCGVCGGNNECFDCTGVRGGCAERDRCNVCGGDGTSCLECISKDFQNEIFAMDHESVELRDIAVRSIRLLRKHYSQIGETQKKRRLQKQKKKIIKFDRENRLIATSLPRVATSCADRVFCVEVNNGEKITSYQDNVEQMFILGDRSLKKLRRSDQRKVKKSSTRLRRELKTAFEEAKIAGQSVPRVTVECARQETKLSC